MTEHGSPPRWDDWRRWVEDVDWSDWPGSIWMHSLDRLGPDSVQVELSPS